MNKKEAIELFANEGWTKADAERALKEIDFKSDPDELTVRKAISLFAGSELSNRQRLQAAQKSLVTKISKELEQHKRDGSGKFEGETQDLLAKNAYLDAQIKEITTKNAELSKANEQLKKDNKALKNLVDQIKLKLTVDTKNLLKLEDSEIRQALAKFFSWTLG